MRDEARVIQLDEWAARVNCETRRLMGVSVTPELPERQEARTYIAGLMTDEEAAARLAADLERVRALCGHPPDEEGDDGRPREAWAQAAREYHKLRGSRVSLAWAGPREAVGAARSTLQTAEFLLQQKDPPLMRRWLSRHGAAERKAILQHLEQRKKRGGGNG
jgi:hypothetical protein